MSEISENQITAAITFNVPQKVGWSVQRGDKSWTGNELSTLIDCVAQEVGHQSTTLSSTLIFELTGNEGTVRS